MKVKQYETNNSFTRKPVPAQVAAYFVFLGEALTFFICMYINYKSTTRQIVILILYLVSVIAQILITLKTSCTDPSDNVMIEYRNGKDRYFNEKCKRQRLSLLRYMYKLRKIDLQTLQSMQKVSINHNFRCVQQFDHHCMWINNCIGSKNYREFMAMIVVTLINMLVYIAGMILLWTQDSWEQYIGSMVTIWVFSVIVAIFSILLINLVGLHFYLIYRGITTYQFIMLQRQQQKNRKQEQQRAKQIQMNNRNRQNTIVPVKNRLNAQGQQRMSENDNRPPAVKTNQLKNQSNLKSHENSDVIFGGPNSNQNKTQKSQNEDNNLNPTNKNIRIQIQERQQSHHNDNDDEQPSPLNSKGQNQSNLSNFFTKNKSLKFFIGDQIGSRPKSTRNQKQNSKQNLYRSLKAINKQPKVFGVAKYVSQVKNLNNNPAVQLKQFKSLQSVKSINLQDGNKSNVQ